MSKYTNYEKELIRKRLAALTMAFEELEEALDGFEEDEAHELIKESYPFAKDFFTMVGDVNVWAHDTLKAMYK